MEKIRMRRKVAIVLLMLMLSACSERTNNYYNTTTSFPTTTTGKGYTLMPIQSFNQRIPTDPNTYFNGLEFELKATEDIVIETVALQVFSSNVHLPKVFLNTNTSNGSSVYYFGLNGKVVVSLEQEEVILAGEKVRFGVLFSAEQVTIPASLQLQLLDVGGYRLNDPNRAPLPENQRGMIISPTYTNN